MKSLIKKLIYFIPILLLFESCNSFLDVKPQDNISEDQVFSSVDGFNVAINGVYADLNLNALYGANLSGAMLDVMAQYFDLSNREHVFAQYPNYDFANDEYKAKGEAIWSKAYELIANTNAVLFHTERKKDMLGDLYYGLYKGEGLALRAFLHFDLFRLFGSNYPEDQDVEAIPYMTQHERKIQPLMSNKNLINLIVNDLLEAKELLKSVDPILTKGVLNLEDPNTNKLNYRQYRMNYFAVCGLLARVYLWAGDQAKAREMALEVIQKGQVAGSEIFPWVTTEAVNNRVEYPDRIFSTEVLFALYNTNRIAVHNFQYSYTLTPVQILTLIGNVAEGRVPVLYPNENDFRRKLHWAQRVNNSSTEILYFTKYLDVTDAQGISNAYRYMFPLIRISEMYLIAAETAATLDESATYLNKLNVHRGLPEITLNSVDELNLHIENEYLREFIGEGQAFFYFKRKQLTSIPSPIRPGIDRIPMQKSFYQFPLPESEKSQRN